MMKRRNSIARCALLLVLSFALGGCAFHKTVSNERLLRVDKSFAKKGETTWLEVMRKMGPPVQFTIDTSATSNISARHLRYGFYESKRADLVFAYWLILPFDWTEEGVVHEWLFEFDEDGKLTEFTEVAKDSVWRPFEGEGRRKPTTVNFLIGGPQ